MANVFVIDTDSIKRSPYCHFSHNHLFERNTGAEYSIVVSH